MWFEYVNQCKTEGGYKMAVTTIRKRDGRSVPFEREKITDAIAKAFSASGAMQRRSVAEDITDKVLAKLEGTEGEPTVEGIQDLVE